MKKMSNQNRDSKFIEHDHLDKIGEVAIYYGFSAAKSPEIKKSDIDQSKSLLEGDFIDNEEDSTRLPLHVEEKVALLHMYEDKNMFSWSQPVMLYFKEPFKGALANVRKQSHYNRYCDLEIIGSSKSIAEATLIQTARVMLRHEGYENIAVEINSIGDKESIARFTRELTSYYRKHVNDMHAECRQRLKRDPFELLSCGEEKCRKINESAPKSISFLSETSRIHFREILEYLEALGIPYQINNNLIGNRKYCTETMFTVIDLDHVSKKSDAGAAKTADKKSQHNHKILAVGVRYDGLAKKINLKKEVQGVGLSLLINEHSAEMRKNLKKTRRPWVSFVQLGFESKLLSLPVVELLREIKIPIYQSLAKDRLGAQVSMIEKNHIPYTIIMGKKEAMEKSVIVRNTETHAQDTVALGELAGYMKKLDSKIQKQLQK